MKIRLTENKLRQIVNESIKNILTELDWKTYMNASRKRKEQADELEKTLNKLYPNTDLNKLRKRLDDKSKDLELYSQEMFQKKHGKNGVNYNYAGESPSYKGRYAGNHKYDDDEFEIKNPTEKDTYHNGDYVDGIRRYRHGIGIPYKEFGELRDDNFDYKFNNKEGWTGTTEKRRTMRYDGNGEKYDYNNSNDDVWLDGSEDEDYNVRQNKMSKDLKDYYTGKSKYVKGDGWTE